MKLRLAIWFLLLTGISALGLGNNGVPPWFGSKGSHVVSFSIGNTAINQTWTTPATTATATISVSAGSEVAVQIHLAGNISGGTNPVVSTVTSSSLTFAKRSSATHIDTNIGAGTPHQDFEVWWAFSSGALTSQVITVTSSVAPEEASIGVTEIKGSFTPGAPWDINGSLPATNNGQGTTANVSGVSITNSASLGLFFWASTSALGTQPSGFTTVINILNAGANTNSIQKNAYQQFSSPQSGVTWTAASGTTNWIVIGDAFAL